MRWRNGKNLLLAWKWANLMQRCLKTGGCDLSEHGGGYPDCSVLIKNWWEWKSVWSIFKRTKWYLCVNSSSEIHHYTQYINTGGLTPPKKTQVVQFIWIYFELCTFFFFWKFSKNPNPHRWIVHNCWTN